jgi:glycosyltransferase involved in cell wall biosynthesis
MPIATLGRRAAAATDRPAPRAAASAAAAMPQLCFVAPHAWPVFSRDAHIAEVGGAEVQQSILARLFAAQGYRVSMICLDYGQPDRASLDGITVHKAYAPQAGIPVLRFLHPRVTSMWRALAQADAGIYYCRAAGMLVGLVAEFCRRHGRRVIYAGASDMDFVPGEGGQIRFARDRWLYRRGLARVDRIVAQNEHQRSTCSAAYGRDAVIIPSCYEPPRNSRRVEMDSVLWVGTVRAGKRPELFLELARRLPQRRFVMVGGPGRDDAPLFERMRAEAARLPNVEFTGFLPLAQAEERFDAARVFVNTSDFEGLPNTFLQAWARGVPTLASVDAPSPAHLRFRGVEDAARAIEQMFCDAALWERASRGCREHFERNHSGSETLRRYRRLFKELAP